MCTNSYFVNWYEFWESLWLNLPSVLMIADGKIAQSPYHILSDLIGVWHVSSPDHVNQVRNKNSDCYPPSSN